MPSLTVQYPDFGPYCVAGTWYACGSGSRFVGCCHSEPCENGCHEGNIAPASFDPDFYGRFPDTSCGIGSRFTHVCLRTVRSRSWDVASQMCVAASTANARVRTSLQRIWAMSLFWIDTERLYQQVRRRVVHQRIP